jgi:hypothetical protein
MHRHHLTRACIDDICQLLITLKIDNAPKSFAVIKRLLVSGDNEPTGKEYTICTDCNKLSNKQTNCLNSNCPQNKRYHKKPIDLLILPLISQLRSIIINSNFSFVKKTSTPGILADITDGDQYKQIRENETGRFFTLTLNVDGVQISTSSNKSLWIFTLVINELPRTQRFKQQNLIIAAIASCSHKPSRLQMQIMLQAFLHHLKRLENGILIKFDPEHEEIVRIYLISSCCDKPAQALVQNLVEPIGAFGCGRCTIKGKLFKIFSTFKINILVSSIMYTIGETVLVNPKSKNKMRVFPMDKYTVSLLRNNKLYDSMKQHFDDIATIIKNKQDDIVQGYRGKCVLRELKYFDVGTSFLSDSLHNCYHGVAVSLSHCN